MLTTQNRVFVKLRHILTPPKKVDWSDASQIISSVLYSAQKHDSQTWLKTSCGTVITSLLCENTQAYEGSLFDTFGIPSAYHVTTWTRKRII